MCNDRVARGGLPACVEACPHEAMRFGDRQALLAEAHRRIRDNPGAYVDHVYGQDEVGGTCVLYISSVPLDSLGWPRAVGTKAIPDYTWPVISKTPAVGLTVAGCLSAITWIVQRRREIARQHAAEEIARPRPESS
jgi:formate dehydrogenase iron-sulfur subunit